MIYTCSHFSHLLTWTSGARHSSLLWGKRKRRLSGPYILISEVRPAILISAAWLKLFFQDPKLLYCIYCIRSNMARLMFGSWCWESIFQPIYFWLFHDFALDALTYWLACLMHRQTKPHICEIMTCSPSPLCGLLVLCLVALLWDLRTGEVLKIKPGTSYMQSMCSTFLFLFFW